MDFIKENSLPEEDIEYIQDILKACRDSFINEDLGLRYKNVRV